MREAFRYHLEANPGIADHLRQMPSKNFFAELKRRNVYRAAVAYAVVSWLIIQVATQVFPVFSIPAWAVRLVILCLILGLPIALVLAWIFELTPGGLKRTEDVAPRESTARSTNRKMDFLIIAVLLVVITLLVLDRRGSAPVSPHAPAFEKSIAVLPFENMSDAKENAFFADGVQDDILTALAKVADLRVISRTSVMGYPANANRDLREIGRALGVAHVVEGSVRRDAGRVRVAAQLIDTRTNTQLWAESYDRDLADVFAIQSEIAQQITKALQATLSPQEKSAIEKQPTKDLEAFDLYTRARTTRLTASFGPLFRKTMVEAIDLLNQAVARDPAFLLAWCELAAANDLLYFNYDPTPARLALAESAVQAALHLRPEAGAARLALAQHLYNGYRDYDRARIELENARRTLPNSAEVFALTGYIDRRQGRWTESTRNLERAIELDPRNPLLLRDVSRSYVLLRRYADAAGVLDRSLTIGPRDVLVRINRAWVDFYGRGDLRPLRTTIDAILAEDPAAAPEVAGDWLHLALCERDLAGADRALAAMKSDEAFTIGHIFLSRAFGKAVVARLRGETEVARTAFDAARVQQEAVVRAQPAHAPTLCALALIDAGLGKKADALREGRRAVDLLPVERDALVGADMIYGFAIICAWLGENDLAFEQLATATHRPGELSYGNLKLHPFWDPLRDDPRFDKVVASLAPKD
jgi:TolB-like protein/Tfp pilus assembly protein PilF